jgi:hypothetical protein
MKCHYIIFLGLVLLGLTVPVPTPPLARPARAQESGFAWRQEENQAFIVGERISYKVRYGVVPSGSAVMEVAAVEDAQGRPAFHLALNARSNKSVDAFHKIREENHSWMDVQSLCSLRFTDKVREGSYRRETTTNLNPPAGRFTHTYKTRKSEGTQKGDMPAFTQDTLSIIYFLRTRPLAKGAEFTIPTLARGRIWPIKVKVKAVEKIRVPAGRFECFHIEPVVDKKVKEKPPARLEVWMTTDSRRVPVLLKSRLAVGSFDARMTRYSPGQPASEAP